jgi:hypothetical protein
MKNNENVVFRTEDGMVTRVIDNCVNGYQLFFLGDYIGFGIKDVCIKECIKIQKDFDRYVEESRQQEDFSDGMYIDIEDCDDATHHVVLNSMLYDGSWKSDPCFPHDLIRHR